MTPAKKYFYVLLGINLLLVGLIIGSFLLINKTAGNKSREIATKKADLESNDLAIKNYQIIDRAINQDDEIGEIALKALPTTVDQGVLINELNQFGIETSTPIKQITFNAAKSGGLTTPSTIKGVSFATVSVQLDKATYDNILRFLQKIENNRRRMQVTTINLAPSDKGGGLIERTSLTLEVYLKP